MRNSAEQGARESAEQNTITVKTDDLKEMKRARSTKMNFSISQIKQSEVKKQSGPKIRDIKLGGSSLMVMNPDNGVRVFCSKIVGHSNFDNFVLFLILSSTILLAIEDPFEKPGSQKK